MNDTLPSAFPRFEVDDASEDALGNMLAPETEEDEEEHRFRDQEEERHQRDEQEQDVSQPKLVMRVDSIELGGMALEETQVNAGGIKAFLTKSSSIKSATSGIRKMLDRTFFDAHDEEADVEKDAQMEQMSEEQLKVQQTKSLNAQVKLAMILKKLSITNTIRRQGKDVEKHF